MDHAAAPQVAQPGLEVSDVEQRHKISDHYVNSYGPEVAYPPQYDAPRPQTRRNPFGLSPLLFALLVGGITAVIVGAALGGGIGGALASCQNKKNLLQTQVFGASAASGTPAAISSALTAGFSSIPASSPGAISASASSTSSTASSASASATATNYAPLPIRSIDTLTNNCPTIDSTTISNHFNQNFKYTCGIDLGNLPATEGGNITDIAAIVTYTVEDCIDACSAINFQTFIQKVAGGPTCSSISWFARASAGVQVSNGNCWLKKGTLAEGQHGNPSADGISAQLRS